MESWEIRTSHSSFYEGEEHKRIVALSVKTASGALVVAIPHEAAEPSGIERQRARLIAAAPDLLEALLEIREACCSGMGSLPAADIARAQAAIAKAEGR